MTGLLACPVVRTTEIAVDGERIAYELRRSRRARRLRIVVTPGRVEVVVPRRVSERQARAFVASKAAWLRRHTEALRAGGPAALPRRFEDGARLVLRGRPLRLAVEAGDVSRTGPVEADLDRGALRLRVPRSADPDRREAAARRAVHRWLDRRLLAEADSVALRCRDRLGAVPTAFRVREQKTLWGSCGRDGVIRLNRRLAAAPAEVFEYVVVHELCHLVEPGHGPRYWRLVARLLPGYEVPRAWLKRNGVALG